MTDHYFDDYKREARALLDLHDKTKNQRAKYVLWFEAERQAKQYADAFVSHCGKSLDIHEQMVCQDTDSEKKGAIEHLAEMISRGPRSTVAALWAAAVWHVAYCEAMGRELR